MSGAEPDQPLLYLSAADVARCAIGIEDVVEAVEKAFLAAPPDGQAAVDLNGAARGMDGGRFVAKPGMLPGGRFASVKWFAIPGPNHAGPHRFAPLVILSDAADGAPLAIMDSVWLTAARTAAISTVAARRLAAPGATRLGLIGAGAQGESHLLALAASFPVSSVAIYSRTARRAEHLCTTARSMGLAAEPVADPRDALRGMDIVVTSVPIGAAGFPCLDARDLAEGAFVSMVDRGFCWDPARFDAFAALVSDDLRLSGPGGPERLVVEGPFLTDIRGLVRGHPVAPGRSALAFSGVGFADTAAAALIYSRALALGLGTALPR